MYLFHNDFQSKKYNTAGVYSGTNLVELEKILCSNAFETCAIELDRFVHEGQWAHGLWWSTEQIP